MPKIEAKTETIFIEDKLFVTSDVGTTDTVTKLVPSICCR